MANKESYLGEFEHIVLLTVLRAGEQAYGVSIRQNVKRLIDRDVSIGALYATLERLEKKAYLTHRSGQPTPERGGRAKRYFKITGEGLVALQMTKKNLEALWLGLDLTVAGL